MKIFVNLELNEMPNIKKILTDKEINYQENDQVIHQEINRQYQVLHDRLINLKHINSLIIHSIYSYIFFFKGNYLNENKISKNNSIKY